MLQHFEPDNLSGRDNIHIRIMKAMCDVIAEPLSILADIYFPFRTAKRLKRRDNQSSAQNREHRLSNYKPVSLTSGVVKLVVTIIRMAT